MIREITGIPSTDGKLSGTNANTPTCRTRSDFVYRRCPNRETAVDADKPVTCPSICQARHCVSNQIRIVLGVDSHVVTARFKVRHIARPQQQLPTPAWLHHQTRRAGSRVSRLSRCSPRRCNTLHGSTQTVSGDRLSEVVDNAKVKGVRCWCIEGGDKDDGRWMLKAAHHSSNVESIEIGHPHVEEHDVNGIGALAGRQELERVGPAACLGDLADTGLALKHPDQVLARWFFIIDDKGS